jgi:hypothetical protein
VASDDDIIAVDIVPVLDESAARDATGKLKDQFKNAGREIKDVLKETVWDEFKNQAKDYGKQVGDELRRGDIQGALGDIGTTVRNTTDLIAKSYEKLAELGVGNQYREHAARHRAFAQEDRQIAERLREMAGD